MPTLATLLLGHLLGDFPLQTSQIYRWKTESNAGILVHVAIHLVVTVLLLREPLAAWPVLILLGFIHFGIDWLKLRIPAQIQTPGFLLDQAAHLTSLLLLAWWWPHFQPRLPLDLIYVALSISLIPGIIMFVWVIIGDLETSQADFAYKQIRPALFKGSQLIGLLVIVGLIVASGTTILSGATLNFELLNVVWSN